MIYLRSSTLPEPPHQQGSNNEEEDRLDAVVLPPGQTRKFFGFLLDEALVPGIALHFFAGWRCCHQADHCIDQATEEEQEDRPVKEVHLREPIVHVSSVHQ